MIERGQNYYYYYSQNNDGRIPKPTGEKPRVFVSHKKEDSAVAKSVAEYIMDAGIDVYFDELDATINRKDPKSVVSAIKRGMDLSSHMVIIFSNRTLSSHWIPWEIGYGMATSTDIRILKMADITKDRLPEYLQVTRVLYDIDDMNVFLSKIKGKTIEDMIKEGAIMDYNSPKNRLKDSVEQYVIR